jgi:hypothetical protein
MTTRNYPVATETTAEMMARKKELSDGFDAIRNHPAVHRAEIACSGSVMVWLVDRVHSYHEFNSYADAMALLTSKVNSPIWQELCRPA